MRFHLLQVGKHPTSNHMPSLGLVCVVSNKTDPKDGLQKVQRAAQAILAGNPQIP